jgi:hypothetical protein
MVVIRENDCPACRIIRLDQRVPLCLLVHSKPMILSRSSSELLCTIIISYLSLFQAYNQPSLNYCQLDSLAALSFADLLETNTTLHKLGYIHFVFHCSSVSAALATSILTKQSVRQQYRREKIARNQRADCDEHAVCSRRDSCRRASRTGD